MMRQGGAAKYQTCAEPFRIARINSAERRRQQIVSRAAAYHSLAPVSNIFELPRMKTCRAGRNSKSHRHHIRSRQRQLSWSSAKDEALAAIAPRRQPTHADVRAHRFKSRGIQ